MIKIFLLQIFINVLSFRYLSVRLLVIYKKLMYAIILLSLVALIAKEIIDKSNSGIRAEEHIEGSNTYSFAMDITDLAYYYPIIMLMIIIQHVFNNYLHKYIERMRNEASH